MVIADTVGLLHAKRIPMQTPLSIIVPTYQEVDNIADLAKGIDSSLRNHNIQYQLLIVDDDSQDGSIELVSQLATSLPISILTRRNKSKGLSESVIDALKTLSGGYVVVMDADLSHPPAMIPTMLQSLQQHQHSVSASPHAICKGQKSIKTGAYFAT